MKRFLAALSGLCLASVSGAHAAAVVVYQDLIVPVGVANPSAQIVPGPVDGLQDWQGRLGMDFAVVKPILVTGLGVFDNGDPSRLTGVTGSGVDVAIFNLNTGLQVGPAEHFDAAGSYTQIVGDAFQTVSGFVLGPGSYTIVAVNDRNYNEGYFDSPTNIYQHTNDVNGSIVFTGPSTYDGTQSLGIPGNIDGPPANRYDAGTFMASAVPEPATWLMMIVGFMGLGYLTHRRRNQFAFA